MRPGAKIARRRPARTSSTSARGAIGRAGSSGRASTNLRKAFIHQRLEEAGIDGEERRLFHQRKEDRRVEERDVVDGDDGREPGRRQVFAAFDLEAEQDPPEDTQDKGEDVRRQAAEEIDRRQNVGEAENDERRRFGEAGDLQQDHRDDRAADHEDIVQRVDGADDPRAPVLARPGLDGGEDRHDEEARRGGIEEDLEGDAQAEARW